jgi:LPXTG-motif cell wall-anchored protein
MSYSAFVALLAFILTLPPTVLIAFNYGNEPRMYHGGSNQNEAPAPIVGAGLPILLAAGGAYWLVRRRRKAS